VVLLFLQNWRSSLIPLIAVPVAVVGTFAVMAAMGFSLNNLTLFGLVLAIGIVVDDAIVVVEAVEHHIEHGAGPREASYRAMEQVSGPVIAIGLVLAAVFVPCAFITGITGQFFRQFALTIAVSTVISAFNSLTLSPALAAILLKPRKKGTFEPLPWFAFPPLGAWLGHKLGLFWAKPALAALDLDLHPEVLDALRLYGPPILGGLAATGVWLGLGKPLNALLGWSFRAFNRGFDLSTAGYTRSVAGLLRVSPLVLVVYGGLLALTWWGFTTTPTGFIPQQDKGYLLVNVQLPDAASVTRTQQVVKQIDAIARKTPGVQHTVAISGQSILLGANSSNFGALYLMLDDFDRRADPSLSSEAIAARLQERLQKEVPRATVNVFGAPPVEGLGTAGGFKIVVLDTGDNGLPALQKTADSVVAAGERPASRSRSCRGCSAVSGRTRRGWNWSSTAPRPRTAASTSTPSAPRCSPRSGRITSTTSTASAAPGRSTSRPRTSSARRPRTSSSCRCATTRARWCRSARSRRCAASAGRSW
jgi:multidrug efflux pump subunit AcrB